MIQMLSKNLHLLFFTAIFFLSPGLAFESVDELTIEEKIGQILMVHFNGEAANQEAEELIQRLHIGHIIYYNWANGLHSREQIDRLSTGLQKLASANRIPIPLIIAVDQEGGVVSRLQNGFTAFPGNRATSETGDPSLAELSAYMTGLELRSVGINMNLAPVVDINTNPRNPVIGIRSFGESPEIVISFAEKSLEGYQRAGVITSLKHFPGHGDVQIDSHSDLPVLNKSLSDLEKMELLPFKNLAEKSDTIMSGHLLVPCIDPAHCATLSPEILKLLRDKIGFKGIIISDSLVMEGVLKEAGSIENCCIQAFNAGCDVLLLGGKLMVGSQRELSLSDIRKIHNSLIHAVETNVISMERLNQAVQRVLELKNRYLFQEKPMEYHEKTHHDLVRTIAKKALKTQFNPCFAPIRLADKKVAIIIPCSQQKTLEKTPFSNIGRASKLIVFEDNDRNDSQPNNFQNILASSAECELTIFYSYNAWKNPYQLNLVRAFIDTKKPLILIPLRDPLDATLFPEAYLSLIPFSPTQHSIEAIGDFLRGL